MKKVNVLVFPCGSEVGLEIHKSLKDISFITLWGASSVADHGKFVYQNYVEGVPFVNTDYFLEEFNRLLLQKKIDYIYPAMDEVLSVLSEHRGSLNAEIIAPEHDTVITCCDKAKTYERLAGLTFLPRIYDDIADVKDFPVIIKPAKGYGSKGVQIINTHEELCAAIHKSQYKNVICEYLPGEEYTVDCFSDQDNMLRYISLRKRKRIRNGISVHSILQHTDSQITDIAEQISRTLPMRGAWFFQVKKDCHGEYKLLEVAARVAGTMGIQRAVGVNLPLLSIFDRMGVHVEIMPQYGVDEVDRALHSAFHLNKNFSEVYCDFDDTMIVHGKINITLMQYLYQCVNLNIPIKLITKHSTDIFEDLKKYRIGAELFDEILHIKAGEKKCDFIRPDSNALFIDDSFAERKEIYTAYGITVLGTDSIEGLIDNRQ